MIEDELWILLGIFLLVIFVVVIAILYFTGAWQKIWDIIKNIKIPKPWKTS
jgi:uncharacterized membrane protein YbhN (UPF0104 family)